MFFVFFDFLYLLLCLQFVEGIGICVGYGKYIWRKYWDLVCVYIFRVCSFVCVVQKMSGFESIVMNIVFFVIKEMGVFYVIIDV